jgi:hypothetical protein
VDDGIFCSPNLKAIKQAIQDLTKAGFDIEDKGTISDYLGFMWRSFHVAKSSCISLN